MKKLSILLLFLFLTALLSPLFADKLEFSVKWILDNTERTTLQVLDYNGDDTFHKEDDYVNDEVQITPDDDSTNYPVCLVRYTTNKRGLSYIEFDATPLLEVDPPQTQQFEFQLVLKLNGAEYPFSVMIGTENTRILPIQLVSVGSSTFNIYVDAVFTDLDQMPINSDNTSKLFRSTLTIKRWTE